MVLEVEAKNNNKTRVREETVRKASLGNLLTLIVGVINPELTTYPVYAIGMLGLLVLVSLLLSTEGVATAYMAAFRSHFVLKFFFKKFIF